MCQKLQHWPFCGHCQREVFQALYDFNLTLSLYTHTRFDDLDFLSRLQVSQNHKLIFVFRFTVVEALNVWYVPYEDQAQYTLCHWYVGKGLKRNDHVCAQSQTLVYKGTLTLT